MNIGFKNLSSATGDRFDGYYWDAYKIPTNLIF